MPQHYRIPAARGSTHFSSPLSQAGHSNAISHKEKGCSDKSEMQRFFVDGAPNPNQVGVGIGTVQPISVYPGWCQNKEIRGRRGYLSDSNAFLLKAAQEKFLRLLFTAHENVIVCYNSPWLIIFKKFSENEAILPWFVSFSLTYISLCRFVLLAILLPLLLLSISF